MSSPTKLRATRKEASQAHLNELLDEALKETFPASDPPAMLQPGGTINGGELAQGDHSRPVWVVRATWIEDETGASQSWEIAAATADEAIKEAGKHLQFLPHHVEATRKVEEKE